MRSETILFDLDGTLSDSAPGITASVAYALEKFGFHEKPEDLGYFVGPPLFDTFRERFGLSANEADIAIGYFRERFRAKGIFENAPYEGTEEMLKALCDAGKKLILATSKPELFARQIIERYGFTKYFTFIGGACMDEKTRMKKEEVLSYCLSECGITDVSGCVMVGDRFHDVEGAAAFGIPTVGVLYGYGTKEELLEAGAFAVCESPSELANLLLEK